MVYQVVIEGWRFLPHSYSIVNQFQCLELLKRENINIFHKDLAYFKDNWSTYNNLFDSSDDIKLRNLEIPHIHQASDITLRIAYPYNFELSKSKRTCVFITSELGYINDRSLWLNCSLEEAHRKFDVTLITPSNWSKSGLIQSGADLDRIVVVPHGIDPSIYRPLLEDERKLLRKQHGIDNDFVFLSIGSMSYNKRMDLVMKAFFRVLEKHPNARLVLKGLDSLYPSQNDLHAVIKNFMTEDEMNRIVGRITYIGSPMSFSELAKLYQIADAYISPYGAEGFNLPVLEAAACGLPVICTKGGSTDDFTNSSFALHIDSQIVHPFWDNAAIFLDASLEHLTELMYFVIERESFRNSAKIEGVNFVRENFTWKNVVDRLLNIFDL